MPVLHVHVVVTQFSTSLGHSREENFADYQVHIHRKCNAEKLAAALINHVDDELKYQEEQDADSADNTDKQETENKTR